MPKIGNPKAITDILCDRCNSKRKVAKTWTEKIKNTGGYMILQHSKIVCTNKECQFAFEKIILEDARKREKLKQAKLDNASGKSSEVKTAS